MAIETQRWQSNPKLAIEPIKSLQSNLKFAISLSQPNREKRTRTQAAVEAEGGNRNRKVAIEPLRRAARRVFKSRARRLLESPRSCDIYLSGPDLATPHGSDVYYGSTAVL